jgi:hypothetical protein
MRKSLSLFYLIRHLKPTAGTAGIMIEPGAVVQRSAQWQRTLRVMVGIQLIMTGAGLGAEPDMPLLPAYRSAPTHQADRRWRSRPGKTSRN